MSLPITAGTEAPSPSRPRHPPFYEQIFHFLDHLIATLVIYALIIITLRLPRQDLDVPTLARAFGMVASFSAIFLALAMSASADDLSGCSSAWRVMFDGVYGVLLFWYAYTFPEKTAITYVMVLGLGTPFGYALDRIYEDAVAAAAGPRGRGMVAATHRIGRSLLHPFRSRRPHEPEGPHELGKFLIWLSQMRGGSSDSEYHILSDSV